MNYAFIFENSGVSKRTGVVPVNELWLDVGNALEMGCFDHHQGTGDRSTLGALTGHPEFLRNAKKAADTGNPIVVHMHSSPDLDCVSSFFAFRFYMEHSEEEFAVFFGPEGKGGRLVRYIDDIDSGLRKKTDRPTLYAVFSLITDVGKELTDQELLEKGLKLIELGLELLEDGQVDLAEYDMQEDLQRKYPDEFLAECELIRASTGESDPYVLGKKAGIVKTEMVSVWKKTKDGMILENVRADIWEKEFGNSNGHASARADGAVLTVCRYKDKKADGSEKIETMISIDPEKDKKHELTLRPLAEILEQMEQLEEQRLYEQTGRYRRVHGKPRANNAVFSEMPFAATNDPWYLRPEEDLVAPPGIQSILDYDDILDMIRNNGSAVKSACAVRVAGESRTIAGKWKDIPLSTWRNEILDIMSGEKAYLVIKGELDASLIRHSNAMLEAVCMSLIGKPYHEKRSESLYFADYNTCVYSDLKCTIILVATYDQSGSETRPVSEVLGYPATELGIDLSDSRLVGHVQKLLSFRHRLLQIGDSIVRTKATDGKKLEELNTEFLELTAEMQGDDSVGNIYENEQYQFIREQFKVEALRTSVMEKLRLLLEESRNKGVAGFNRLSALAVPFIIIATVFQMGVLRIDYIINVTGGEVIPVSVPGWGVLLAWCVIGVLSYLFYKWWKRK